MRLLLQFAFLWLTILLAAPALAVSVEDVPNPREQNGWVSDTIDILEPGDEKWLNYHIDDLERDLGVEVAVVTVEQVDTPTPKDFATELFNYWGIGKAEANNGLLILLVRGERRLEMETGYGMESKLTNTWLKRMQTEKMVPLFKQGDYGPGVIAGFEACEARLRHLAQGGTPNQQNGTTTRSGQSQSASSPAPNRRRAPPRWVLFLCLGGLAGLVGIGGGYIYRKNRTCPECNLRMEMVPDIEDGRHLDKGQNLEEALGSVDYQIYFCNQCGFDRTIRKSKWFSSHSSCRSCGYKTLDVDTVTIRRATEYREGKKRITEDCRHCSHRATRYRTIPRIERSDSSSSGGGGGGFGGGSSGGGGAGSSW